MVPRVKLVLVCTLLLVQCLHAENSPEDAVFTPGEIPKDTSGLEVHAHGGGMLQQNGTFFWYGTTQKYAPAWISKGINLYSSRDLQAWDFEGQIFSDSQIQGVPFQHPFRIERPKILFDRDGKTYTLLFHLDTPSFALTSVGVAKAADIRGPWQWNGTFKPDGLDSFDMTAWQDDDGSAYLARSVQNAYLGVSKLDRSFTKTLGICGSTEQAEAPAIFKPHTGQYYIIASHLTGWAANAPQMFASEGNDLCDGRLHPVDPPAEGPGSETTYESQPAYVFPLRMEGNVTLFIYMGDRWNFAGQGSVGKASYVWLPLLPKLETGYELVFRAKWSPKEVKSLLEKGRQTPYKKETSIF